MILSKFKKYFHRVPEVGDELGLTEGDVVGLWVGEWVGGYV